MAIKLVKKSESGKWQLNAEDCKKIGKGAGIALSGALLTYFASIVGEIDFGAATPMLVAVFSIMINTGLKWVAGK